MNLFGRKKQNIVQPSIAIHSLQDTIITMEKRELHLEKQIAELSTQAKKAVQAKRKARAIMFLRKKKLLEKQQENIFNTKMTIETQIVALTQALANTEIVSALKKGRDALKGMETKVNPDDVADIVDDMEEQISTVDEVAEVMARPIGSSINEDELLAELEAELADDIDEKLLGTPVVLPTVPSIKPTTQQTQQTQQTQEEKELKELEALMSL